MKCAYEMGSGGMIYIQHFMKIVVFDQILTEKIYGWCLLMVC
jgi:hypothetical protein